MGGGKLRTWLPMWAKHRAVLRVSQVISIYNSQDWRTYNQDLKFTQCHLTVPRWVLYLGSFRLVWSIIRSIALRYQMILRSEYSECTRKTLNCCYWFLVKSSGSPSWMHITLPGPIILLLPRLHSRPLKSEMQEGNLGVSDFFTPKWV